MSDTQAKRLITWRVEEGLLGRIDVRAAELGKSRSAFLVWAAENALDDASRGVPDVPREETAQAPVREYVDQKAAAWARQQKLNEAKYGRRR